jgi:hypothetical protein
MIGSGRPVWYQHNIYGKRKNVLVPKSLHRDALPMHGTAQREVLRATEREPQCTSPRRVLK